MNGVNKNLGISITVAGVATFHNSTRFSNLSTLYGDVVFNDTSYLAGGSNIVGDVYFNNLSHNQGTISGNATFDNVAIYSGGTVSGDLILNYVSGSVATFTNKFWYGEVTGTIKNVTLNPITEFIFNSSSSNFGIIPVGINVNFNDSFNQGVISGNATFNGLSNNNTDGVVSGNATFNDLSFNYGTVVGDATFTYASGGVIALTDYFLDDNSGQVWGTVEGIVKGGDNINITSIVFNDHSYNLGIIPENATATFHDESYNSGTVSGNAIFHDESYNDGTVSGNAIFNNNTINYGVVEGYACFRDAAYNNEESGTVELGELCPPIVTTSPVTAITQTGATLNGEIVDNEEEIGGVTERGFEYGTTTSYGADVNEEGEYSVGIYSLSMGELTCNTTYHVRAYTTNDFDTTYGEDITFTTSPCSSEPTPPTPPRTGSSGGSVRKPVTTVCNPGDKYSSQTGLPCTTYTPSTNVGPTAPTTCTLVNTLRQGSKGAEVKCLQTKLNITSDGIFGPKTKAAVIFFQKNHNLVPDGIVGPKTRQTLPN